jgi:hypothetical protein
MSGDSGAKGQPLILNRPPIEVHGSWRRRRRTVAVEVKLKPEASQRHGLMISQSAPLRPSGPVRLERRAGPVGSPGVAVSVPVCDQLQPRPGVSAERSDRHSGALSGSALGFDVRLPLHPGSIASPEPDPEAFRLAYEEAKRGLDDQEQAVVELRSRAGTLIAAAAITTSFFGSQALRSHVHVMSWIAIGCFVALGASVLVILWPRRDWEFTLSPERFISTYLEPTDGDPCRCPRFIAISRFTWAAARH